MLLWRGYECHLCHTRHVSFCDYISHTNSRAHLELIGEDVNMFHCHICCFSSSRFFSSADLSVLKAGWESLYHKSPKWKELEDLRRGIEMLRNDESDPRPDDVISMQEHVKSYSHRKMCNQVVGFPYFCAACAYMANGPKPFEEHNASESHCCRAMYFSAEPQIKQPLYRLIDLVHRYTDWSSSKDRDEQRKLIGDFCRGLLEPHPNTWKCDNHTTTQNVCQKMNIGQSDLDLSLSHQNSLDSSIPISTTSSGQFISLHQRRWLNFIVIIESCSCLVLTALLRCYVVVA